MICERPCLHEGLYASFAQPIARNLYETLDTSKKNQIIIVIPIIIIIINYFVEGVSPLPNPPKKEAEVSASRWRYAPSSRQSSWTWAREWAAAAC